MPSAPTFSIVVPLYNKRRTILRTLDSVLAQSDPGFEVVVVDDGSTDGGAELVRERGRDRRIRLIAQPNAGPGAARNAGLASGRGSLVAFLDADDEWDPQFLATARRSLEAHPECGAFASSYLLGRERIDRWSELVRYGFREGPWDILPDIGKAELSHCLAAFSSSTVVYRRGVIETCGGFYSKERCTFGEDVYLWIQIMLNHRIYRHMTPLAHYHTEDSDLGIGGRKGDFPLEPVLTDPEPIRAACPTPLRPVLELWLARHALVAAFMQLERGSAENAAWLAETYPMMSAYRADHMKLRLRMSNPKAWDVLRAARRRTATPFRA